MGVVEDVEHHGDTRVVMLMIAKQRMVDEIKRKKAMAKDFLFYLPPIVLVAYRLKL